MGAVLHYTKIIGGGLLAAGLAIGVIVLGIEVARLSSELEEIKNDQEVTTSIPTSTTEDPESLDPWDREYRLPDTLVPEHYDLYIFPKFHKIENETFTGVVKIQFTLTEDQEYIAIHQKGLDISNVTLKIITGGSNEDVEIKNHFSAPKNEFYVLLPNNKKFSRYRYELKLDFSGNLKQPEIVGLYTSNYNVGGSKRKLVTSKFEPTYARRAFPCFDEPAKKATFTVSLVQPNADALATEPTWSALSNMNEEGSSVNEPEKGFTTVRFKKSVKMSTYLACFIVSEFGHKKDTITNTGGTDVTLRTFAPAHLTDYTEFALEAAKSITEFYVIYFGIPYRLPKLDLIAIPDFVSGAMEHWGLITFRESNMIVDPSKSSAANQQRVGQVVAHELAHMWFGNLVTMKWWDDLWLNEGFASYIEYKGLDQHKPEMRVLDQFLLDDMQPVLALDAQLSSHPVIQHVEHPDQITEIFDTITYSKGSAVLRMLENFLTPDVFRSGVTDYLKSFEYENAETRDLWASLQKASNASGQKIDVARVMDTWTLQMGLPVITVKFDSVSKTAILSQSRFLATPEETAPSKQNQKNTESPFGYKWDVPITYRTNSISEPSKTLSWLNMEDDSVKIQFDPQTKWIKINADQYGFYRVNYDENMWKSLTANYVIGEIKSPLDRSALIDDAFSLAEGMLLNYTIALNFAEALKKEIDYIPWRTATTRFQQITPLVRGKLANQKYKSFLQYISSELYSTYGWTEHENDDHIKRRMRTTILSHACSAGLTDCLQKAGEEFEKWIIDETVVISPNLRPLVYGYGMEEIGNSEKWKIVFDRYLKETDAQERSRLLVALAAVKDPSILETFVQLAWDENNVRGQDYFSVLQNIADNPIGTPIIWDYVRSKWTMLVERFTLNNRYLGQMIPRITKNFATPLKRKEMELFFEAYPEAGAGESSRAQALERVDANIKWVAQHYPVIADWLEKWTPE